MRQLIRAMLVLLLVSAVSACEHVDTFTVYCSSGCDEIEQAVEAVEDMPYDQFPWNDDPVGHVFFVVDDTLMRVAARPHAAPLDLDNLLDGLSPGSDASAGPSPSGVWLALDSGREICREEGQSLDEPSWNCLATAQLGDRTRELPDGSYQRTVGTFGVSALQPVRLSGGRLIHDAKVPVVGEGGGRIVFVSQSGQETAGVRFGGPEGGLHIYGVSRMAGSNVWSDPVLLSGESPFPYHGYPRLSPDGRTLVMDCFDELDVTLPRSICEVAVDGSGFRVAVTPEMGDVGGRPSGMSGATHHASYAPDGSIVFESDWAALVDEGWQRCEAVWRLAPGSTEPEPLDPGKCDDNTPCVLPDGRVASLWLPAGGHEIKVLEPADGWFFMLLQGRDVADVSLGCSY